MDPFEEVLTEFESAWQRGEMPNIEKYLPDAGGIDLLVELIHLDLDYRLKRDDTARVEDYLARFPQLPRENKLVASLALAEFRLRDHLFRQPDPEELLDRFPEHRETLEALLAKDRQSAASELPMNTEPLAGDADPVARHIGPYKLLQLIGEGGMGSVYMAEQAKPIRRRVALKVIKPGMDSRQVLSRFDAEKQALAMMDHPNIARVLDAGITNTGQPYFAMELVKGTPITKYCDDHSLPLPERLNLFRQACNAIQHAHQKGIIHRDIKPSNVLVSLHDGTPLVKVIDFGLAKALQPETRLTEETLFTEFGQIVGTFQYMSPEQAEVNALDIDTRSDVYSLGVLLYELLTGSTPIERQRFNEMAFDAILSAIRSADPPRPSVRLSSLEDAAIGISKQRQVNPSRLSQLLRGDLDWIAMKALEKDRTRRYESAADFAADVQRYLRNEAVVARPPSVSYWLRKTFRRHRALVLTGLAFISLLLLGAISSTLLAIRATAHATRANTAEQTATKAAENAHILAAKMSRLAGVEAEQRRLAVNAQREAETLRQESEARERRARHNEYAAHLTLASQALQRDAVEEAQALLARYVPHGDENDLRSFPWYYLMRESDSAKHVLTGHAGIPTVVVFSHNGEWLASGGKDSAICLWKPETGELVATLKEHGGAITGLAFDSKDEALISTSLEGTVSVWKMPEVTLTSRISVHPPRADDAQLVSMAILDATLVCGLKDGFVDVRNWRTGETIARQQVFTAAVEKVTINAKTNQLGIIGFDKDGVRHIQRAKIWDLVPSRPEEWQSPRATIELNAYDETKWTIWRLDQELRKFDFGEGERVGPPTTASPFHSLVHGDVASGRVMQFRVNGKTVQIDNKEWNLIAEQLGVEDSSDTKFLDANAIRHMRMLLDEGKLPDEVQWLVADVLPEYADEDTAIGVWDLPYENQFSWYATHPRSSITVHASPVTSANRAQSFTVTSVTDLNGNIEVSRLRGHKDVIISFAFCPTTRLAASASLDGTIRIWNLTQPNQQELDADSIDHWPIAFHPKDPFLYTETGTFPEIFAFRDGLTFYDAPSGRLFPSQNKPPDANNAITVIAVSDEGVATISKESMLSFDMEEFRAGLLSGYRETEKYSVRFFDTDQQRTFDVLEQPFPVRTLAFLPGKHQLAIGRGISSDSSAKGRLSIWDTEQHAFIHEVDVHEREVSEVASSPDGNYLATVGSDGVRIWNVDTWESQALSKSNRDPQTVAFSHTQPLLAVVHSIGIDVWNVADMDHVVSLAHKSFDSCFTPDGRCLVVWSRSGELRFVDTLTWEIQATVPMAHDSEHGRIECSADGRYLACRSPGKLTLVRAASREMVAKSIEAKSISDKLVEGLVLREAAIDHLQRADLPAHLRAAAIGYAKQTSQDPEKLNNRSKLICRAPSLSHEQYQFALRCAEEACRLRPGDVDYFRTLGTAQFRTGNYAAALETMSERPVSSYQFRPWRTRDKAWQAKFTEYWAIKAMIEFRLGNVEAANQDLQFLLAKAKTREDDSPFVQEAMSMIRGKR